MRRKRLENKGCIMKAVLDTKPSSSYDDEVSQHYQFPKRYLSTINKCPGDWVILRRPRADGGNLAYFAVARIAKIERDPDDASLNYARFEDYTEFNDPVPWFKNDRYAEKALREIPKKEVGIYMKGRSVRALEESDFADMVLYGLQRAIETFKPDRISAATESHIFGPEGKEPELPDHRVSKVKEVLESREVRTTAFRQNVYDAYDNRCAISGMRILDEKGNSEVHGAHIQAVADMGPDVVQNGIALSATVHWLFDRYIISLTDDHRLLAKENLLSPKLKALLCKPGQRIKLPEDSKKWPHPKYLARHRERFNNGFE